ncbi:hypothetical protein H5T58_01275 [Candidatus Parcubacteria bacterium]|nr:hypothetical protein [Candidatus Parcubacteria bacterium]
MLKDFPFIKTKSTTLTFFNLTDPLEERKYFKLKAGKEIEKIKDYLRENSFVAYLIGKKNSGKGTYSKMFANLIGKERIEHFSVGDMVRKVDQELRDKEKRTNLLKFLEKNYRGPLSLKEALDLLENRDTTTLLPTELILTLIKREMIEKEKKALFIDGFPRNLDQIDFSLFFRDLVGYREDPDVFFLFLFTEAVIFCRNKFSQVCPKCQTPRNLKLLPTSKVVFEEGEFHLICDQCGVKMVKKEGDELGIEAIRERLKQDEILMERAMALHGIPKILLRNSIPCEVAKDYVEDYEITPEYYYEIKGGQVQIKQRPWKFLDDESRESFSLLPQPVVVSLLKQLVEVLGLK